MSKLHYYDSSTVSGMPSYEYQKMVKEGKNGAICGYTRKVTHNKNKVTCFYCKKEMERRGIL